MKLGLAFRAAMVVLAMGLIGCAEYKPPAEGAATALIKGKEGMIVSEIDGQSTGAVAVNMPLSMFSNEVKVLPGTHRIGATTAGSASMRTFRFMMPCEADHVYTVEPKNLLQSDIVVRDATLGTVLTVEFQLPRVVPPAPATQPTAQPAQ